MLAFAMTAGILLRFGSVSQGVVLGGLKVTYAMFAVGITVSWLVCLELFRTRDARIVGDGVLEYRRVVRATFLMFGALAIASVLLQWDVSRGFLAISFPVGLLGLLLGRKAWRIWLARQRKSGLNVSRVLVVGGLRAAKRLADRFNGNLGIGMAVSGVWVPDGEAGLPSDLSVGSDSIPVLGADRDVLEAVEGVGADTVIVTDSEHLGPEMLRELTWLLDSVQVDLLISPNLVDISSPRMHLGTIGGEPFIHLDQPQYSEAGTALKGFFDVALGLVLLVFAAPLLILSAVAIRLSSRGPALFTQVRMGRGGRTFKVLKLRTMVNGADLQHEVLAQEAGQAEKGLFKLQNDPRITLVGRFLRRFSIDELPQLINVIKGDMSLVGPRPLPVGESTSYTQREMRRLTVRPGITGLWQVSGRSDLDWDQTVQIDLYYVENWSMTADLVILWRTVRAVLRSEGAY
ncbi:MAG: sugar transferase [Aeromicrobium sp.]